MRQNGENGKPSRVELYETLVSSIKYETLEDRLARLKRNNNTTANILKEQNNTSKNLRVDTNPNYDNFQRRAMRHRQQLSHIALKEQPCSNTDYRPRQSVHVGGNIRRKRFQYQRSSTYTVDAQLSTEKTRHKEGRVYTQEGEQQKV